jgi:hypothetical protein
LSTNYEFDDAAFSVSTEDRGVLEIRGQIWGIYDDLHEHRLDGKWALSDEQREIVHRVIMFLKSDAEYRWPKVPIWYRVARPIIWLASVGRLTKSLDDRFCRSLDMKVWPFLTTNEIDQARSQPKYLSGTA